MTFTASAKIIGKIFLQIRENLAYTAGNNYGIWAPGVASGPNASCVKNDPRDVHIDIAHANRQNGRELERARGNMDEEPTVVVSTAGNDDTDVEPQTAIKIKEPGESEKPPPAARGEKTPPAARSEKEIEAMEDRPENTEPVGILKVPQSFEEGIQHAVEPQELDGGKGGKKYARYFN